MTDKEVRRLEIIESIKDAEKEIGLGVTTKDYSMLFIKIKNDLDSLIPSIKKNYEAAFFADDAAKAAKEAEDAVIAAENKATEADNEAAKATATPEIIQAAKDAHLAADNIKIFAKEAKLAADKALIALKKATIAATIPDLSAATKEAEEAAKEAQMQADLAMGKKPTPSATAAAPVRGGPPTPPTGRGGPPPPPGRGGPPPPGRGGPPPPGRGAPKGSAAGIKSGSTAKKVAEILIPHNLNTEMGKISDALKNLRLALETKDEENIAKLFQQFEKELNENLTIPKSGIRSKAWSENVDTLPFLLKSKYGDKLKDLYDKLNADITDAIAKKEYHKVQPAYEQYLKDVDEIKQKLMQDLTITTTQNNSSIARTFFSSDPKDDAFRANFSTLIEGTPLAKLETAIRDKSAEFAAKDKAGEKEKPEPVLDFTNNLAANKATLDQKIEIIHKLLPKMLPADIEKATDLTMLLSSYTPRPVMAIQAKLKTFLASMHSTQAAIKEDEDKLAKAIPSAESKKSLLIKPDGSINLLKLLKEDKELIALWNKEKENKIKRDSAAASPSAPTPVKAAVVLAPITIPKSAIDLEAGTLFTSVLNDHFFNLTSSSMTDREYAINSNLEVFFERSEADKHLSTPETILADTNFLLETQKGAVSKPGIPNIFMLAIASGYIEKKPFSVFNRSVKDFVLTSPKTTDELVVFFASDTSPAYNNLKKLAESSPSVLSPEVETALKKSFASSIEYHKKDKWIQSILSGMGKTTVIPADKLKDMLKSWTPEMNSYISTLVETDGSLKVDKLSQEQIDIKNIHKNVISNELEPVLAKLNPATMTNLEDFEVLSSLQNGTVQISDNPDTLDLFHQLATEMSKQLDGVTPPTKAELQKDLISLIGDYSKKHFQESLIAQVPAKQSVPIFSEEAVIRKRISIAITEAEKAVAQAEEAATEAKLMVSGSAPTPEAEKKALEAATKAEDEAQKARVAKTTTETTKDPDVAEKAMKEAQAASREAKKQVGIVQKAMEIKPSAAPPSSTPVPAASAPAALGSPSPTFMSSPKSSSLSSTGVAADGSIKGSLEQEAKLKTANEKIEAAKEQKKQQERLIESYEKSQSASPISFAQTGGITKLQTAIKALGKAETEISEAEIEALAIRISIVESSHTGEAKNILASASQTLAKQSAQVQELQAKNERIEKIQALAKETREKINQGANMNLAITEMSQKVHHEDWEDVSKEFIAQISLPEKSGGFKLGNIVIAKRNIANAAPDPTTSSKRPKL